VRVSLGYFWRLDDPEVSEGSHLSSCRIFAPSGTQPLGSDYGPRRITKGGKKITHSGFVAQTDAAEVPFEVMVPPLRSVSTQRRLDRLHRGIRYHYGPPWHLTDRNPLGITRLSVILS
jgi:hypothetical protein